MCPPLNLAQAAELHMRCSSTPFSTVIQCSAGRRVVVLDGRPGPWVPDGFAVRRQRGRGQGHRLAAAFAEATGPALLIGMDTPQVTAGLLDDCLGKLVQDGTDAVLGSLLRRWVVGPRPCQT
jgi:uncharacterized protein